MSTTSTPTFDLGEFKRALEERDSTAQLALYAPDAEVTLIDRINTPSSPRVLRGREEIRSWVEDICERDMTHRVDLQVLGDRGAAFTENCRYPDGTNVLCAAVLELRDGQITRQVGVQAWDEQR
jgi:ketosteroid isomerase-like protein